METPAMPKLHELKHTRAGLVARMRALAEQDDDLTPDQGGEFDSLREQVAAMDGRIARLEEVIAAQAEEAEEIVDEVGGDDIDAGDGGAVDPTYDDDGQRAVRPTTKHGRGLGLKGAGAGANGRGRAPGVPVQLVRGAGRPALRDAPGLKAARFVIGLLAAKSVGMQAAAAFIEDRFGDKYVARALNTAGVATGGALIPQQFANELIELLRANTVVRSLNPRVIPMPGGNLTIPRLLAGATSGYQGELDDMALTQQAFDTIQLNAKKLTTMVSVSNDLIRRSPLGIEELVRDDMVQTMARREDLAFLLGDGSGGSPVGLLNLAIATQKLVATPFTDPNDNAEVLGKVIGVLNGMLLTLRQNMSPMTRPAWIMSAVVESFLTGLRDQVGAFVFKDELAGGTLMGIPFATTQQLPTNLNTGTTAAPVNNGSYLFLADMDSIILADTFNMSVEASDTAAYKDAGGNMVSTFQRDQSVFRVVSEHDINTRYDASLAVAVLPGWAPNGFSGFSPGAAYYVNAANTLASAAPSTFGTNRPTGSNNPANTSAAVPGGTLPGLA